MPLKIYWFSHINPSLKEKVRVTNFFSSPELLSVFLAGQKPRNLLICTKPLLKNKIGSQFFALSCICSCCSLFRSKEIPVKRVGIKSTVSLSELWTYASFAAAYLRGGPGWANGRPPGKAKFANALPPGPTRGKISHSGPQGGGNRCSWN